MRRSCYRIDRERHGSYPLPVRRALRSLFLQMAVLVTALTMPGCATRYRQPPASESGVAYLEAIAPVWLVSIDGAKVSYASFSGEKRFRISPGRHVIEVRYSGIERQQFVTWDRRHYYQRNVSIQSRGALPLSFAAEAGHTYYIQPGAAGGNWQPYINESMKPVFTNPPPQ